jgi:hypothetical protein
LLHGAFTVQDSVGELDDQCIGKCLRTGGEERAPDLATGGGQQAIEDLRRWLDNKVYEVTNAP